MMASIFRGFSVKKKCSLCNLPNSLQAKSSTVEALFKVGVYPKMSQGKSDLLFSLELASSTIGL